MNKRTEESVIRDGGRQIEVGAEEGTVEEAPAAPAAPPSGPPVRK